MSGAPASARSIHNCHCGWRPCCQLNCRARDESGSLTFATTESPRVGRFAGSLLIGSSLAALWSSAIRWPTYAARVPRWREGLGLLELVGGLPAGLE
eukprot:7000836-Lingulodinium_polyedra.AAC.1